MDVEYHKSGLGDKMTDYEYAIGIYEYVYVHIMLMWHIELCCFLQMYDTYWFIFILFNHNSNCVNIWILGNMVREVWFQKSVNTVNLSREYK